MNASRYEMAIAAFDDYNSKDPHREEFDGASVPKELLYAQRMSKKLLEIKPDAEEYLKLAARSQHIGRWEIPRASYPMDRAGYLKWRGELKIHHSKVAEQILLPLNYDSDTINKVKALLMKKPGEPETQLLEDVICLVFIEFYLAEFAAKQEEDKVIDILKKTMKKMSKDGIQKATQLPIDKSILDLLIRAAQS